MLTGAIVLENLPFACLLTCGLGGIVVLSFLEKLVPVMPSYVLLVVFGLVTVDGAGDLAWTVLAATIGSVAGGVGWYLFGRCVGGARCERLVERYGKYLLLPPSLYRRLVAAYSRHHFWVTAIGQTVPTARIYLALPAGVIGLSFLPFVVASALGTVVWNAPLIAIGYLLRGTGWDAATIGIAVVALIIVIEATVVMVVARRRRRPRVA